MLPWAVIYKRLPAITGSRLFGFWEMLVYIGFVAVGLFYVYKKKHLRLVERQGGSIKRPRGFGIMAETTEAINDSVATPSAIFGKDAVTAALADHAAVAGLGELIVDAKWDRKELTLTVAPETIVAAAEAAKAAGYNFFEDLTAVDWYPTEPRFQLRLLPALAQAEAAHPDRRPHQRRPKHRVDHLCVAFGKLLRARGFRPLRRPFSGHPRLTRIMMPDNWNGHPLRKDYRWRDTANEPVGTSRTARNRRN